MTRPQPRYNPGDRIGGRYQVHKSLMGGMGEVYLCLDLEENYPYALKTFQQRYLANGQALRRTFEQEVATWVALEKHPNIVRCFHLDTLDRQPFMVLEWIASEEGRGTDLRGWLRRGPLELKLALQIAIDICHGLLHAQTKHPGLVHRDLKPENILIDQDGLAKITDFGLATIVAQAGLDVMQEASATNNRHSIIGRKGITGTPAYMAPEQWRNEPLNQRTDIYALGCILHELLTGASPFMIDFTPTTSQQVWLTMMQHAHETMQVPPLPTTFTPAVGDLLSACLAKSPLDRPTDLNDLVSRLTKLYQVQLNEQPPLRPNPSNFSGVDYNNRGATYAALHQYERALADFGQAIALDPNHTQAYYNRGITYTALQQYKLALVDYSEAIALDPNDAKVYSNRGNIYADLQQYEHALADYNRAITLDSKNAKAYYNRGITYADLQQYEHALVDYDRAIILDSNDAKIYYNRGNTHKNLHEYELALADYSQAIALAPAYAQAYYNRGITYAALQEYELALADYSEAITLDPNDAQAYYHRGRTYADLQQYGQALADFGQTINLAPADAKTYYNRGVTYAALQEYERALTDYSQAIMLEPDDALAYCGRGDTYADLQEYERALADYGQAIVLDPNDALVYLNIGVLLSNQGKYKDALAYFEQAAQLGNPQGAEHASQARRMFGMEPEPPSDPAQAAFEAFQQTDSVEAMQQAVTRFPLLTQPDFIAAIEQAIAQIPPEHRRALTQRLTWLRQIANTQRSTP